MRKLILLAIARHPRPAAALTALPAGAKPRGSNGQIAFARFDPALGDTVAYTINPDGTHEQQVPTPTVTAELRAGLRTAPGSSSVLRRDRRSSSTRTPAAASRCR